MSKGELDKVVESYVTWWKEIYRELEEVELEGENRVDATNLILECVESVKVSDDINGNSKKEPKEFKTKDNKSATDNQKDYMDDLGIKYNEDISKEEASKKIDKVQEATPATDKQKEALKKANRWKKGMSKKKASEVLDDIYGD